MTTSKARDRRTSRKNPKNANGAEQPRSLLVPVGVTIALLAGFTFWFAGGGDGGNQETDDVLKNAAALNDLGRFSEAASLLQKPDLESNARAQYLTGIALENTGRLDEAVQAYSKCLEMEPNNSDALNNRAVVLGKLGKYDEAIQDFEKTVELNESDSLAWANLGLALHSVEKYEAAIEKYNKAEELTTDSEIPFQRGNTHLALGNLQSALADFDKAVAADVEFALAHYKRAVVLIAREQFLEAAQALANAKQFDVEMELRALIVEMEQAVESGFDAAPGNIGQLQQWLVQAGWEITESDQPEFAFYASRLPVAGAEKSEDESIIPADFNSFYGLILQNKSSGLICPSNVVDAITAQPDLPVSLFVFDASTSTEEEGRGKDSPPVGYNRIEFNWKPSRDQFKPTSYAINLPSPTASPDKVSRR
ncbi:MAG: tetratricopeptide repeat protein [Planctomycetota bacterium]